MNRFLKLQLAVFLLVVVPAVAQHPNEGQHGQGTHGAEGRPANYPRANQGRIPPPPERRDSHARVESERREDGRVNAHPHVSNDHWYGHDRPNDRRYHFDHPYGHGHFEHFGPSYRYTVERFDRDRHRFWLPGGYFFEVAPWDWPVASAWCWDCGDDFVVYEDTDHEGWYMLYNVHTGIYVHVSYFGR